MTSFQANSVMATVTTVTIAPARLAAVIHSETKCPNIDIFETDSCTTDLQFAATVRKYEHRRAISLGFQEDKFALVLPSFFVFSCAVALDDAASRN